MVITILFQPIIHPFIFFLYTIWKFIKMRLSTPEWIKSCIMMAAQLPFFGIMAEMFPVNEWYYTTIQFRISVAFYVVCSRSKPNRKKYQTWIYQVYFYKLSWNIKANGDNTHEEKLLRALSSITYLFEGTEIRDVCPFLHNRHRSFSRQGLDCKNLLTNREFPW